MRTEQLALVQGWDDTRATLWRWRARPAVVVAPWLAAALAVAAFLLLATWVIGTLAPPDDQGWRIAGRRPAGDLRDYGWILYRNGLVLALHAMACVAGFMAGSSLPLVAEGRSRWWRRVHDHAGRLAIYFVCSATIFSLGTQAYALGALASTRAAEHAVPVWLYLVAALPHAVPELVALFLPLGAWLLASRRRAWHELLAATFVTTALAVPLLLAAAAIEVWVSPSVLYFLK